MTKMEKAIICDDILRRFKGNGAVRWVDLREEFKDNMHQYYVTENNINFLVSEGMIRRNSSIEVLNLTDKGFATLAEIDTLGYEHKEEERLEAERQSRNAELINRAIQIAILIISLAALIIAIVKP